MSSATRYRISDVPRPSGRSGWVVNPMFPLLGAMLGGALLSWAWFCINSMAMNSPKRWGDVAIATTGLVVSGAMVGSLLMGMGLGHVTETLLPYGLLLVTVWKLTIAYILFLRQVTPYNVFSYYSRQSSSHGPQLVMFTMLVRFLQPFPTVVALVLF